MMQNKEFQCVLNDACPYYARPGLVQAVCETGGLDWINKSFYLTLAFFITRTITPAAQSIPRNA